MLEDAKRYRDGNQPRSSRRRQPGKGSVKGSGQSSILALLVSSDSPLLQTPTEGRTSSQRRKAGLAAVKVGAKTDLNRVQPYFARGSQSV